MQKQKFFIFFNTQQYQRYPTSMFQLLNLISGEKFSSSKEHFERFKSLYIPTKFLENKRGFIDVQVGNSKESYSLEELLGLRKYSLNLSNGYDLCQNYSKEFRWL
jgi:hypothetical protein